MIQQLADNMVETWRSKIAGIRLRHGIALLGALGSYQLDRALILTPTGLRYLAIYDTPAYFHSWSICSRIRPIYFNGGPFGGKRYRGTLETLILDRLLLTATEKGGDQVLRIVNYVRNCYK